MMSVRPVTSLQLDAPETVYGITQYLKQNNLNRILDPLAGTGYWARRMAQEGFEVTAIDLFDLQQNTYHRTGHQWFPVEYGRDALQIVQEYPEHVLWLSWPPYDESLGADILKAYKGNCVVYMGEGCGGCCGDYPMFNLLETEWELSAVIPTINWGGIHSSTEIYRRK
jgi:hypothetical protein